MRRVTTVLIALCLPAGAHAGGGGGLTLTYTCAGGARIHATYAGQHARVVVGARVLEMNRGLAASGERYVGEGHTWWVDGHTAELYRGENSGKLTSLRQCQQG